MLLVGVACQPAGIFAPGQATRTPSGALAGEPVLVSFSELDAAPRAYRDRLIRVSGAFQPLPARPCAGWHGPDVSWSLVDEGLQMEAGGYGSILRLLPAGVPLTVDGFWRLYQGPLGCGKEPPVGSAWYLEAVRLVQPNPLPLVGAPEGASPRDVPGTATAAPVGGGTPLPTIAGTAAPPAPGATATASPTGRLQTPGAATATARATLTPAPTGTRSPTATRATRGAVTPTASPSRPGVPFTPRPTETPRGYPVPAPTATPDPYAGG